jgi:hypothetical protein
MEKLCIFTSVDTKTQPSSFRHIETRWEKKGCAMGGGEVFIAG